MSSASAPTPTDSKASPLLVVGSVMVLTVVGTNVAFGRFWRSDLLDNLRARAIQ